MSRLIPILIVFCIISCSNSSQRNNREQNEITPDSTIVSTGIGAERKSPEILNKVSEQTNIFEYTSDGYPKKRIYAAATNKDKCLFVISKVHPEHLSVYEVAGRDTNLLAIYPVCIARNKGQKERRGDNRTPESYPGKPFSISQIQDASDWHHDFGDGRGSILAYGHWFMRLVTPGFSGIGIHGSTGNRESIINGRGSEGCIRLLDEDIIHLKNNYAQVGTPVIILPEDFGPLPFEIKAMKIAPSKVGTADKHAKNPVAKATDEVKNATPAEAAMPPATPAKTYVTVKGYNVMLRTGPNRETDPIYEGRASDGDKLEYLGKAGDYYKVIFEGKELYINPSTCYIEE